MQEPTFLILTVLAGQQTLHGYGITQAIEEVSAGEVTVRPGTLYAALDRLTAEGLVEVAHEDEWAAGRVRRHYRLTSHGSAVLRDEAERRRAVAALALDRLGATAPHPALGSA